MMKSRIKCNVDGCVYNENGVCAYSGYICINHHGKCDTCKLPTIDLGLKVHLEVVGNVYDKEVK